MELEIRFCTSADGTRIAYATYEGGPGTPLVQVDSWYCTEEWTWSEPGGRALIEGLAHGRRLVSFDRRGIGASQREVDDLSLEAHLADLAAIVDQLSLEQFDLIGWVDGAAVSVAFAAQHPERVSRLVLYSPYARGEDRHKPEATRSVVELIRANWPLAQRTLADLVFSDQAELRHGLSKALRRAVSPEVAARYVESDISLDLRSFLTSVQAPTLILERRGIGVMRAGLGQAVATLIPDARFVALDSSPMDDGGKTTELVRQFLDERRTQPPPAEAGGGLVSILFTDIESSTTLTQTLGDAKAQELVRAHNIIVREALSVHDGTEIKHTGDGIMASFAGASSALGCAVAIQKGVAARAEEQPETPLGLRVGLNAGEPVVEEQDLFGASVQLAKRICDHAEPGQILASNVVRELAMGKGFLFSDIGEVVPKGFEEPVRLYEVRWQEEV